MEKTQSKNMDTNVKDEEIGVTIKANEPDTTINTKETYGPHRVTKDTNKDYQMPPLSPGGKSQNHGGRHDVHHSHEIRRTQEGD